MGKVVNIKTYEPVKSSVVTIGTFDGVHIGHQKIVKRLVKLGGEEKLQSIILTFFPHPRMVLQKDVEIKLINTIDERSNILEKLGLNYLLVKEFTLEFSRLSAQQFVEDILVEKLKVKKVIIGYDHRFGRNRNADINDLIKYGKKHNFEVEEISMQDINDVAVSSTKIRKALINGEIEKANKYLGYPFMLTGNIVKGKGIGRKLGFPTANINIKESYKLVPQHGAYVVKSSIKGKTVFGMMNIGMNPTVNANKETIEVHFFNFEASLYNEKIQVNMLHRIRDEQKFNSIDDLKEQLQNDKEYSINYIKEHHVK